MLTDSDPLKCAVGGMILRFLGNVRGCSSRLLGVGILHSLSLSCTCFIQLFFVFMVGSLFTNLSPNFALYFRFCIVCGATS